MHSSPTNAYKVPTAYYVQKCSHTWMSMPELFCFVLFSYRRNCFYPSNIHHMSLVEELPLPHSSNLLVQTNFIFFLFESCTSALFHPNEIKSTLKIYNSHFITYFKHYSDRQQGPCKALLLEPAARWEHSPTPSHT